MANNGLIEAKELRTKKPEELKELLLQYKKESFNLRFQKKSGELDKTDRIRKVKRNIAIVNTVINEQKGAEANA